MKLYLHIGTEKTGSSYLQSTAALNRDGLKSQGFWFPLGGKRESDMQSGRVSPGNAQVLTDALYQRDLKKAHSLLKVWMEEAEAQHCSKLLLSNELLVLALAEKDILLLLNKVLSTLKIQETYLMLLLREPVDLALSLYRHRAKRGTALEIEDWIQSEFAYGDGLKRFFEHTQNADFILSCRKYDDVDGYLEKIFFNEWLVFSGDLERPKEKVNVSLTLSELLLIKNLRTYSEFYTDELYERLLKIPAACKAENKELESYYRSIVHNALMRFSETWKICLNMLPLNEDFEIPVGIKEIHDSDKLASFSAAQLASIGQMISDVANPKMIAQYTTKTLRKKISGMIK